MSKTSSSGADRSCKNDFQDDIDGNRNNINEPVNQKIGVRFWTILVALSITGLLTALEQTITSTALPTIISSLGSENQYIWVVSAYFLTRSELPLLHQETTTVDIIKQNCVHAPIWTIGRYFRTTPSHSCGYCYFHSWKWYLWRGQQYGYADRWSSNPGRWCWWN